MYATDGAPERAKWEVLWVHEGRVVRKKTGADLAEALRIYDLARDAGRKAVTLRCCNMGFPPPVKLQPRVVTFDKPRMLHGKRVSSVRIVPLRKLNHRGVWYCPYCMKLRRFVKRTIMEVEGIRFEQPGMHCPMCGVSHRDWHIRRWNPLADNISARVSDPNRKTRRRRRTTQED